MLTSFTFTKVTPNTYIYQSDYIRSSLRGRLAFSRGNGFRVESCRIPEYTRCTLFVRGRHSEDDHRVSFVDKEDLVETERLLVTQGFTPVITARRLITGHSKTFVIRKEDL